jgi:hypothetical protein
MFAIVFTPLADAELTRLERDPLMRSTVERIWDALDRLCERPALASFSQRLYRNSPGAVISGFTMESQGQDWLILWERSGQEVIVHYLGDDLKPS